MSADSIEAFPEWRGPRDLPRDLHEAQDDRDALEKHAPEADPLTGELPWGGFRDGRIQDFMGLDWAGEKLIELEAAIVQNEAARDAAVQRLNLRTALLNEPLRKRALAFRAAIETYAQEQGCKGICIGRLKSRTLPSGLKLSWRERKTGEYRWDQSKTPAENKAALLAWAMVTEPYNRAAKTLTVLTRSADLAAVKEHLAASERVTPGKVETPPGLEWAPPGEALTVGVEEP